MSITRFRSVLLAVPFALLASTVMASPKDAPLECHNPPLTVTFSEPEEVDKGVMRVTSKPVQFDIDFNTGKPGSTINVGNGNNGVCSIDMRKLVDRKFVHVLKADSDAATNYQNISVTSKIDHSLVTWEVTKSSGGQASATVSFTVDYAKEEGTQ